jgi:hypothetical protein
MNTILGYAKSHWVTLLALATAIWAYSKPTVTSYVGAHPASAFWFGLVSVVVTFYLKSPLTPKS